MIRTKSIRIKFDLQHVAHAVSIVLFIFAGMNYTHTADSGHSHSFVDATNSRPSTHSHAEKMLVDTGLIAGHVVHCGADLLPLVTVDHREISFESQKARYSNSEESGLVSKRIEPPPPKFLS